MGIRHGLATWKCPEHILLEPRQLLYWNLKLSWVEASHFIDIWIEYDAIMVSWTQTEAEGEAAWACCTFLYYRSIRNHDKFYRPWHETCIRQKSPRNFPTCTVALMLTLPVFISHESQLFVKKKVYWLKSPVRQFTSLKLPAPGNWKTILDVYFLALAKGSGSVTLRLGFDNKDLI